MANVDGQRTPSQSLVGEKPQKAEVQGEVVAPRREDDSFMVVGIGASAGGLEALERFFSHMPSETGMAFVVVQHLSPDFKSLMDELLAQHTKLPIHRVTDGVVVKPDAVYLIPPKKEMIISAGRLLLTDKDPGKGLTLPIDQFFRSLSQDVANRAVGIILSGTGSDGSRGIRDIHAVGGLVLVQSVESAKFDGMPRSAMDTGIVDQVLAPEEMAAALLRHVDHPLSRGEIPIPRPDEVGMSAVFSLLRQEYGLDFSHYKPNTVIRRTERRLSLNQSADLNEYIDRLKTDPQELNSLYRDLLIGVTSFFRDADAFDRLATDVLVQLLSDGTSSDELRIWVAGCATGEEAYSVAMLLHEQMNLLGVTRPVKVFATDVHRASLDFASAGVYPEASLTNVSLPRRERYFFRQGRNYQVSQELRQMIVFAPHNVIRDAPFTRLDLITCRNMLIYLQPLAQKKALSLFHFGLKTGGYLFLGPSESPAELSVEFDCLDEHWKVFRKRRDVRLPADMRLPLSVTPHQRIRLPSLSPPVASLPDSQLLGAYDALLAAVASPGLLINEQRQLVHVFGGAEKFLRTRGGRPSMDVLDQVDPEMRIALAGALQRSVKSGAAVVLRGVQCQSTEGPSKVTLTVRPLLNRVSNSHWMVAIFEPLEANVITQPEETQFHVDDVSRDQIRALEAELQYTKENLQATIEELETSNEELQATNEELVASNEELQSTNEELHSVNEELYTVNAEYQRKIAELTELTDDMDNLLKSTDIGTIFLDHSLCIRKFTPQIARAFDLLPQDVGRRIDTFSHNIEDPNLISDVARVLRTGCSVEREVCDRHGSWLFLKILPYRAKQGVDGVVLNLIDISGLKRAEAQLSEKDTQLRSILDNATAMIFVKDLRGRYVLANRQCEWKLGVPNELAIGRTDAELLPAAIADIIQSNDREVLKTGQTHEFEEVIQGPSGQRTFLSIKFPLRDQAGEIYAIGGIATDISRRVLAEEVQREAVQRRDEFLALLSHELRNPLGAVLNATKVMDRDPSPKTLEMARRVITRQSQQMARLLDDLLDVSRITQGKIEIRRQVVDLRDTVEDVVQSVQPLIEERAQALHVEVYDKPLNVEGDSARLQQIQVNLLTNASKYTPMGESIRLSLRREGTDAVIRVQDSGIGIAPEMLDRVFDMFVQAKDPLHPFNGGMGVGLTLCRSIVHLHHGQITAHSDGPGTGSEFVVRLPLTTQARSQQPPPEPLVESQLRIAVVEDNDDSRMMLGTLLELYGHEVLAARDGEEGLEMIERERPDIAFVDVGLPLLDGYEVARRARQRRSLDRVRLIALTGYGQVSDREAARQAGFDEHLTKPLQSEALLRVLSRGARERPLSSEAS